MSKNQFLMNFKDNLMKDQIILTMNSRNKKNADDIISSEITYLDIRPKSISNSKIDVNMNEIFSNDDSSFSHRCSPLTNPINKEL